ncbi:hypothetical protein [Armatimonas sp.]|uniref:hypothetical protein n=1 Tax=Armatimonas sp. TaxID=1872638 RepID=UPI00374D2698
MSLLKTFRSAVRVLGATDSQRGDVGAALARFLQSPTDEGAARELAALTERVILPVCRTVLWRQLGAEGESLLSEAAMAVTQRLERWRKQEEEPPLRDLEGYIAVVTRHTIDKHLRIENPEWLLLRNRILYRFRHDPRLESWKDSERLVCGRAGWQGKRAVAHLPERTEAHDSELALPTLCLTLLDRAGGPVALDELAKCVGQLYNVNTSAPSSEDNLSEIVAAPENLEEALLQRTYLEKLWIEVRLLPQRQAAALLLNLRDSSGRGVIELLLALGLAQRSQVAEALGWTQAELGALWERLPIEDNEIAELLGATRQQVINLRKVARERLERRMRAMDGEGM